MLSKLQVMDRSVFKKTALLAVGAVLLYYSVAWAVLRCPHLENRQAQEIAAYEPGSWHRHANLDCKGPKYHTEFLAGPSNSEVLRLAGVIVSQGSRFVGFADPALKRIDSPLRVFDEGSLTALPFDLPRYLSLSVLRF
jgi:hypothetical protein